MNNFLFIISGPSGSGKTTVTKHLLDKHTNLVKSISMTTRTPRENEIHGDDYYFVDKTEHDHYVKNNLFLESAHIFNNYYGTPKNVVTNALTNGNNVIFDIDIQGYNQIKKHTEFDIVSVFLLPESLQVLKQRLVARGTKDSDIATRLSNMKNEIAMSKEYDYIVLNKDLYTTCENIDSIYQVERLKRTREELLNFINHSLILEDVS